MGESAQVLTCVNMASVSFASYRLTICFFLLFTFCETVRAVQEQASGLLQSDSSTTAHDALTLLRSSAVPLLAAGVVVVCLLSAYVIISCTDCYKSEVSSEFHPATASQGTRWGGAGGYTSAVSSDPNDRVLGAGFTAEVIPGEGTGQGLPYAMIPTQVPEAQGFRGYTPAGPPQRYGSFSGGGRIPGAHISAVHVESEEPPPSYSAFDPRR